MTEQPSHRRVVKALGHPLRIRIMELVVLTGEQSPSSIARVLDHPLATVSRHVRLLRDAKLLELVRTEPRRGSLEHFYRARELAFLDDAEWAEVPVTIRRSLVWRVFREIFHEASLSGAQGGFDDPEMHLDRVSLELDAVGRRELSQVLHLVLRQADAIQRRSDERTRQTRRDVQRTTIALLHFRAYPPDGQPGRTDRRPPYPPGGADRPPQTR